MQTGIGRWERFLLRAFAIVLAGAAQAQAQSTYFVRGDSNLDGPINIADPVYTLRLLFLAGADTFGCDDAADANDDGKVNVVDPTFTLLYLFAGGAPPPPPFIACGPDPTADRLACRVYGPCARRPPTAAFTAVPLTGRAPLAVAFDGSGSTDPDGTIVSYSWDFGDGAVGTGALASHTYLAAGTYSARLVVTDNDGVTGAAIRSITVLPPNVAPTADLTASPTTGKAPLVVAFDGSASADTDGTIVSHSWDFGDGGTSTGALASHTYASAGVYAARLIVTDNDGATGLATRSITVLPPNVAPTASFAPNTTTGKAPLLVSFDGSASADADGTIVSYSWDFGDGEVGAGVLASHIYASAGNYTAKLLVTDNDGATGLATHSITVLPPNVVPAASFTASPSTGKAPLFVSFDGSSSVDPDGTIVSYGWDFGDGGVGSGAIAGHTYTSAGSYTAKLVVSDQEGAIGLATRLITVLPPNVAPTASFASSPTTGKAPLLVSFDGSSSADTDGTIVSYSWEFGDGGGGAGGLASHMYLSDGSFPVKLVVTDEDGATATATGTITVLPSNTDPTARFTASPGTGPAPLLVTLDASASTDPEGGIATYAWDFGDGAAGSGQTVDHLFVLPGTYSVSLRVTDDLGGSDSVQHSVAVQEPVFPIDPSLTAPPPDLSVARPAAATAQFLYTGPYAVQTGMDPATIETYRAAVVSGKVLERDGAALPGVTIRILDHPEFGQTVSRADGAFDMALNGGGEVVVVYEKSGHLTAHRTVHVPWQDFAIVPDVVLVALDPQVTAIDLSSAAPFQVARGSQVSDETGERRATLLFPAGNSASAVLPGGTLQPLTQLGVRATEYTVGPNGERAMPAALPPTSAYTYAVELSVDEALSVGADEVRFTSPVVLYVDNFLIFPIGERVPLGFYDRKAGRWVAAPSGVILRVIGETGGIADVDLTNDTIPDNAAALSQWGVTAAERAAMTSLYAPGDSFWRVTVDHFSPYDLNLGWGLPDDSEPPDSNDPETDQDRKQDDPSKKCGSIIEVENQVLGESVDIVGTPFSLNYRSDRVPGRTAAYKFRMRFSGSSLPTSLQGIEALVNVAGRQETVPLSTTPDGFFEYTWDGLDRYGRPTQGQQPVTIEVSYAYQAVYGGAPSFGERPTKSFGIRNRVVGGQGGGAAAVAVDPHPGQTYPAFSPPPPNVLSNVARGSYDIRRTHRAILGTWNARDAGLGGWTLSPHHAYDGGGKTVYHGDGSRRTTSAVGAAGNVLKTIAGTGHTTAPAEGMLASATAFPFPTGLATLSDGSYYVALGEHTNAHNLVVHVGKDGVVRRIAGIPGSQGHSGDGGPAINATLFNPQHLAIGGPDSSLYVAEDGFVTDPSQFIGWGRRVRKIDPQGTISTLAGDGTVGFAGDGGLATAAKLRPPLQIAVDSQGAVYIAERDNRRIRRVTTDGIITTIAGRSFSGTADTAFNGDGIPALEANIQPTGIAVGSDGKIYFGSRSRIRFIDLDGRVQTVVGPDQGSLSSITVLQLGLQVPFNFEEVALSPEGDLFATSRQRIWRVTPQGGLTVIVGGLGADATGGFTGDGTAIVGKVNAPRQLSVSPDGSIVIADRFNNRVRRVAPALPGVDLGDVLLPNESGSEVYVFDDTGRHLRTLDAILGVTLHQFSYGTFGESVLLTAVTDRDGLVTSIQRDGSGLPTSITGPFGQRTALEVDATGYLRSVEDPQGNRSGYAHTADGLLVASSDPNGSFHQFRYDPNGLLIEDQDPTGAVQTVDMVRSGSTFTSTFTSGGGRTTVIRTVTLDSGGKLTTTTLPDETESTVLVGVDDQTTAESADGTVVVTMKSPDPRWGMVSPVTLSRTIRTPSGIQRVETTGRTVVLSDPKNPLSVSSYTEAFSVNGKTSTVRFDAATRTFTSTSPLGRTATAMVDALGRIDRTATGTLLPTRMTYDSAGRVIDVSEGSGATLRVGTFEYDDQGNLEVATDPLGREQRYSYDAAGRVFEQVLPGGQEIAITHDPNGNIESLSPPERPAHAFEYSRLDLVAAYAAPPLAGVQTRTTYRHNADRVLVRTTRPDGRTIEFDYTHGGTCGCGHLSSFTTAEGTVKLDYEPTTGQLTGASAPSGVVTTYSYDGALLTGEIWSGFIERSIGVGYDTHLRVVALRIVGEGLVSFAYDDDGLLTRAGQMTIVRDAANGLVTTKSLGAVTQTFAYDAFGELTERRALFGGSQLYSCAYVRDSLGRIITRIETRGGITRNFDYGYAESGFLTDVSINGALVRTYDYDANGNRIALTNAGSVTEGTYDDQDRLLSYGNATYTYGADGQLINKTDASGQTSYDYDALGNLLGVAKPDGTLIEYVIDDRNRRVGKKLNGVVVQKLIYQSQLQPIAELASDDSVVSGFVYTNGSNSPAYMVRSGAVYAIVSDQLGSPRVVINVATGAVAQELDYDEFGRVILDTNPGFQPFGFAGGIYDPETGLARFGARDYDAEVGRWTAQDPTGFAGSDSNLYLYVEGDPISRTDPTGQCPWCVTAGVGFAAGAGIDLATQLIDNGGSWGQVDWSSVVTSGATSAAVSMLMPTGLLLGRGGAKAVQFGYSKSLGLLNRGPVRFGWSGPKNGLDVLSLRIGKQHLDLSNLGLPSGANPGRDGLFAALIAEPLRRWFRDPSDCKH